VYRRDFLKVADLSFVSGISTVRLMPSSLLASNHQSNSPGTPRHQKPDFSLRIAPMKLEVARGRTVQTIGYSGSVPGLCCA